MAKNLFLWPGRSLVRKGIEAYLAAAIELLWPKRRILEVYLNIAEMGTDVYGVGAAADVYFGKAPASLTRRQAALLAAALPDPKRRHPDRPSEWLSERARWIETQMDQLGGAALPRGRPRVSFRNCGRPAAPYFDGLTGSSMKLAALAAWWTRWVAAR